jgi:Ni,Fe-hydrogenase III large subunit
MASGISQAADPRAPAAWFANGTALRLDAIPARPLRDLAGAAAEARRQRKRLIALFPQKAGPGEALLLVTADADSARLAATAFALEGARAWPSITPLWPEAHLFEREIHERWGLLPEGHPWLKAVRGHRELEADPRSPPHPFLRAEGEGVHEVAVGPIHAGIIEPGHFRFQCFGEEILHLEIQLGYQQRGAERMLEQAKPARRLVVAESIAGDTAVGHALAYCAALEGLSGTRAPLRAQAIRGLALELERISNHVGDLGALCNDVGYLPGAAYFGRLRGDFLNLLLELSGNRFGRSLVLPGGVRFDVTSALGEKVLRVLDAAERDLRDTFRLMVGTPSVLSRFEGTGVVTREAALELGFVGPTARACGVARDARTDHPLGVFQFTHVPVAVAEDGDVMARANIRWLEVTRSLRFIREQVARLPEGPVRVPLHPLPPSSLTAALVEGWRGQIVHLAITDGEGRIVRHKVIDPSFHNWLALALAVRGAPISDFPLCNKSFNLSYAGHDL